MVACMDVPEEVEGTEDPPGVAEKRFVGSGLFEQSVDVVEIRKVCVDLKYTLVSRRVVSREMPAYADLDHPIWLSQYDSSDIKQAPLAG